MATFSDRLRELRKERDITLDELAEILGTTKATLSRYENNLREPKAEFVEMFSRRASRQAHRLTQNFHSQC